MLNKRNKKEHSEKVTLEEEKNDSSKFPTGVYGIYASNKIS